MTAHAEPRTEKLSVSLPHEIAEQARRAVRDGRATSVSTYLAAAAAKVEREDTLQGLLDDLIAQHGQPSEDDLARVDKALGFK